VVREPKTAALPADERRALAYLAQQGVFRPGRDGTWPLDRAPSGATIAAALARIGDAYKSFDLDEGTVAATDARTISVVRGQGTAAIPLGSAPRLFTAAGPRTFPVGALQLWPGDRIRYHLDGNGHVDLIELRPPAKGLSDDRSAAVYSWEVRKTAAELQDAVDKRVSVGTLKDLRVVKRGVSGRIVELEVVGSAGSTVVKGFDVRNLLDLRESLTVIELQRDASGRIASVVFAGKGWGTASACAKLAPTAWPFGSGLQEDPRPLLFRNRHRQERPRGLLDEPWRAVIPPLYSTPAGRRREELVLDGPKIILARLDLAAGDARALVADAAELIPQATDEQWAPLTMKLAMGSLAAGFLLWMLAPVGNLMRSGRCAVCGRATERRHTYCLDHLQETVNATRDRSRDRTIPRPRASS
jgi:hypothetical protein